MATATARWNDYATDRDLISGGTYSIVIDFSESVTGLSSGTLVFAPDYTITGDTSRFRYSSGSGTTYIYNVYLTSDPGSIRIQLAHDAVTPNLDEDFDWTLGWLADGSTYTYPTNQVGGSELAITLDTDYVAAGELVLATFTFSRDIPVLPISAISLTEGLTLEGGGSPNNRVWTQRIRVPDTGKGVGVVSIAENAIFPPGNDAASASFTYIDTINADISLSAASAQNGETILAQFDFDYDVPDFSSSFINAGSEGNSVLGAGNQALELGGQILGIPSTSAIASVGTAVALSDDNRSWQVPIELPVSGEGMLEIELPEDAIGFQSAAVAAEVQFAPSIDLNIALADNLKLLTVIDRDFKHDIRITGNNISKVDVKGLLRPFYHQWFSTTGTLSILGKPTAYYKDLEFTVEATDRDGATTASAEIDVIDVTPTIIKPAGTLRIARGVQNSFDIEIKGNPNKVEVEGTWMGLDHRLTSEGVRIFGEAPPGNLGISSGDFIVNASNTRGNATEISVPFEIVSAPSIGIVGIVLTGTSAIFSWTAVTFATSYAYRIGSTGPWVDVGNVTTHTLVYPTDVDTGDTVYWRVNLPWIGSGRSVTIQDQNIPRINEIGSFPLFTLAHYSIQMRASGATPITWSATGLKNAMDLPYGTFHEVRNASAFNGLSNTNRDLAVISGHTDVSIGTIGITSGITKTDLDGNAIDKAEKGDIFQCNGTNWILRGNIFDQTLFGGLRASKVIQVVNTAAEWNALSYEYRTSGSRRPTHYVISGSDISSGFLYNRDENGDLLTSVQGGYIYDEVRSRYTVRSTAGGRFVRFYHNYKRVVPLLTAVSGAYIHEETGQIVGLYEDRATAYNIMVTATNRYGSTSVTVPLTFAGVTIEATRISLPGRVTSVEYIGSPGQQGIFGSRSAATFSWDLPLDTGNSPILAYAIRFTGNVFVRAVGSTGIHQQAGTDPLEYAGTVLSNRILTLTGTGFFGGTISGSLAIAAVNVAGTGEFVTTPFYVGATTPPPVNRAWTQSRYSVTLQRPSSYNWSLSNLIKEDFTVGPNGRFPNTEGGSFSANYAFRASTRWVSATSVRSDQLYSGEKVISTNVSEGYVTADLSGGSLTIRFRNVFDANYHNVYASVSVGVHALNPEGTDSGPWQATFTARVSYPSA